MLEDVKIGDSIAVNGICLTVTAFNKSNFIAAVMAETLAKTNLLKLAPGHKVNLERALRLGDRLGGHWVTGHIDGTGIITKLVKQAIAILITIQAPPEVMRYTIAQGSVTIDGTSLTVIDFTPQTLQISLIPHTADHTILGSKKAGDLVNLEVDILGKYIERLLVQNLVAGDKIISKPDKMTSEFLTKHGFV